MGLFGSSKDAQEQIDKHDAEREADLNRRTEQANQDARDLAETMARAERNKK